MDSMSRYRDAMLITSGENIYHGTRKPVDSTPKGDDRYLTVGFSDTLHSLAQRHLNDFRLWWVLADFNDIIDPFGTLVQGSVLRAPSMARLWMETLR